MGEHNVRNVGVRGSNPLTSTNFRAKVKEVEEAKKEVISGMRTPDPNGDDIGVRFGQMVRFLFKNRFCGAKSLFPSPLPILDIYIIKYLMWN